MLQLVEARVSDANLDPEKRQVDVAGVSPVKQTAKDKLVPSKMSLGAGKRAAVEPVPAAAPAASAP